MAALLKKLFAALLAGIAAACDRRRTAITLSAGTPDAAIARVNAELVRQFQEPKFAEFMENQYIESTIGTPQAFAAFMKADRERIGQMVRQFNIPRQ